MMTNRLAMLSFGLAALALSAGPLAAEEHVSNLPGVSDKETVISGGGIQEFHRGHGDVMFVRDRANRWFRVALNDGCLRNMASVQRMSVDSSFSGGRIDNFSKVTIYDGLERTCLIDSIRRSEAPPQVDSKSRVTLD